MSWRRSLDLNWCTFLFIQFFVIGANTTMSAFTGLHLTVIFHQALYENDGFLAGVTDPILALLCGLAVQQASIRCNNDSDLIVAQGALIAAFWVNGQLRLVDVEAARALLLSRGDRLRCC
jgi:hypothetical protein